MSDATPQPSDGLTTNGSAHPSSAEGGFSTQASPGTSPPTSDIPRPRKIVASPLPPASPSRAGRISSQAQSLFTDVKEWTELRAELLKVEVKDAVSQRVNEVQAQVSTQVKQKVVPLVLVAILGLFFLIFASHALANGLTELVHPGFAYLIVALLYGVPALIIAIRFKMRMDREARLKRAMVGELVPEEPSES
ncbi:MAG: phage holin family protein [Bacteroidota bacterium]